MSLLRSTTSPPARVEPTYSPLVQASNRKSANLSAFAPAAPVAAQNSSSTPTRRHSVDSASSAASLRPKYQCPACLLVFMKWSPCLSHLREHHLDEYAHLLDKKQNGGDFRRVQEWCASQLKQPVCHRGERTDSLDSLSSTDTAGWGGLDESSGPRPASLLRSLLKPTLPSPIPKTILVSSMHLLKNMDDRMIFRIFSFLDVDSAQFFYLAMEEEAKPSPVFTPVQASPHTAVAMSRVRIWSNASNSSLDKL
ncbi:hypothetical protein BASA81_006881 [Batrachochytrium salamandrivorans]|nr:hypothetical protein BASA81_006881 [Batrachochytrium salamandrivorans]